MDVLVLFADGTVKGFGDVYSELGLSSSGYIESPAKAVGLPPMASLFNTENQPTLFGMTKDGRFIWTRQQYAAMVNWQKTNIGDNVYQIEIDELLHVSPAIIKATVPDTGFAGSIMDVRTESNDKLFVVNESGDTTIAGNLKFDGDMDLDASATETLTQPYNNPVISVADGELINFFTNELISGQYQHMDMDSHGNIYVSVYNNKTGQSVNKIYKITQSGEISEFHSSSYNCWCIHLDKDDIMYLTTHSHDRLIKIVTNAGVKET